MALSISDIASVQMNIAQEKLPSESAVLPYGKQYFSQSTGFIMTSSFK